MPPGEQRSSAQSDFAGESPLLDLLGPALHLERQRGPQRLLSLCLSPPSLPNSPAAPSGRPRPLTQLMGHREWNTR